MLCQSAPLVVYEENRGYFLPDRTQELLRAMGEESLVILSIVGKPKTGKSYILNHIISNPQAFQVNSHVTTSTKGIQMSTRLCDIDGKKVLVLDNESFGTEAKANHDSKVFFLNMLLSSVLIYNNFGVIDEHALTNLSLIINLGQSSQPTKDWGVEKPCLLWLVRDFILRLQTSKGEPCTAKEYLEKILDEQKGLTTSISQKNNVRSLIKEVFPKRDCETLVRPAKQEKELHKLASIPFTDLRKEFLEDVRRMKQKLSKCIKYKKINGHVITGPLVVKLVKAYLESFNRNVSTNVKGIWTMMQTEQKREVTTQLDDICEQIVGQYKEGRIQDIDQVWEDRIKDINTLNSPDILGMVIQKKSQCIGMLRQAKDIIIPITFQEINLDFLQSTVQRSFVSEVITYERQQEINCTVSKVSVQIGLQRELDYTKRELQLTQQKCKNFQRQRETILKAIQSQDKHIQNIAIASQKRDEVISAKYDQDGSNIVSKLLEMYQKLEEKYEKVTSMSKNTFAYICNHCKQEFEAAQFQSHIQKLQNKELSPQARHTPPPKTSSKGDPTITESNYQPKASFFTPYIIIPKGTLTVDIEKTLIKQDQQHRNYIQYIIKVSLKHTKWIINRKYKDFCQLHDILLIMLPELQFPDSSALIKIGMLANVSNNVNKKNIVEERRKTLQNYLTEIIDIDEIRNTRILQKFLKINQEYKESDHLEDEQRLKSKSPLAVRDFKDGRSSMSRVQFTNPNNTSSYSNSHTKKFVETKYRNTQK